MRKSGKETAEALEQLAKQNPLFNKLSFSPSPHFPSTRKKQAIVFVRPSMALCVWAKLLDSFQVAGQSALQTLRLRGERVSQSKISQRDANAKEVKKKTRREERMGGKPPAQEGNVGKTWGCGWR